jgi:hypothetical protein
MTHFLGLETQACTAEKCESTGAYLPPSKSPDHVPDYQPPIGKVNFGMFFEIELTASLRDIRTLSTLTGF